MYSALSSVSPLKLVGNLEFSLDQESQDVVSLKKTNEKITISAVRSFENRVANGKAIQIGTDIQFKVCGMSRSFSLNCAANGEKAVVFEVIKDGKKFDVSLSEESIKEGICSSSMLADQMQSSTLEGETAQNRRNNAIIELSSARKSDRFELLQEKLFPDLFPEKTVSSSGLSGFSAFWSKMASIWKSFLALFAF